ncbi:DUF4230 domain-containing protein [Sinomicrobium pectinilyticum]|uniref:DUF4230 domain-containing protein n=1 Tax=Sinomicrobium pectinilyticum TaxID=1084421 RepID=UPI001F0CD7CB|nr:DUF4230 domain-containing protein [Sinomicrobium pectinilyticum]
MKEHKYIPRPLLRVIIVVLLIVCIWQFYRYRRENREILLHNTTLLEKQIKNVGKLIVTEGNYAQVFTFEDSKKFYLDILSARKKALVVVNATAKVSYDLSKIKTEILEDKKTVIITYIPPPELEINPKIEYYDIQQDYFNRFDAGDHNKIRKRIENSLRKEIDKSTLMTNSRNRLLTELHKIYLLTNSMGWTLQYRDQVIQEESDLFRDSFIPESMKIPGNPEFREH